MPRQRVRVFGLSARLLLLTIAFVLAAEVLIYVPSVANFRRTWLKDRLAAAQIAALVLDAAPPGGLSDETQAMLLGGVDAQAIGVTAAGQTRWIHAAGSAPPAAEATIDIRNGGSWWGEIRDTLLRLVQRPSEPLRVVGPGMGPIERVDMVLDERPLRAAMLQFSRRILLISLAISLITGALVFLGLHRIVVRPVRRLASNIAGFAADPENGDRIIVPSARRDEIGTAEQALARMEGALAEELREKRRLAELGLAVSKINHELRNILTTAQLLSDRLGDLEDPRVRRVAPRLVATLGRAIDFCEATLAYGRAREPLPQRRRIRLAPIVAELADVTDSARGTPVAFRPDIPEDLEIDADAEQLSRVLLNLIRNAVQALSQGGAAAGAPEIRVSAQREGRFVTILVADNGPGVPERARANLFAAFRNSVRPGGTGLGLPVADELVRLHGGTLSLDETPIGAAFRVVIPDRF